ncbi:hypothetical protein RND81_09G170200 [Saponaria officinalis]|uniref:Uncharacterized protein n=1 Tax=Saponaria officinalis TaxID=3572 RepID=A0AAW1INS1_SAPOF
MAIINDDVKEDTVTSAAVESVKSYPSEDALSPNDFTWVNSCLNNDGDDSHSDWSSIKDALSEIFNSQSGQIDSVVPENNTRLTIDQYHSFRDYIASLLEGSGSEEDGDLEEDDFGDIRSLQLSDYEVDDFPIANRRARARGNRRIENIFRPNYTEDIVKIESNETGIDLGSTTWEVESSSENIFKVWDLEISDEQDDFTKQLTIALAESPLPINPDDSTALEDIVLVSVDDLISGIGDLSLKQNTD